MPKVVIAYDMGGDPIEEKILGAIPGIEIVHTSDLTSPESVAAASNADAIMVTLHQVNVELISKLERCKIISRVGTGLDAIDIPGAAQKGIWVCNVPDYCIDEVSTHAITLMLMLARSLPGMQKSVHDGTWYDPSKITPFRRLRGQTLGVFGYGRIGTSSAAKGRGLGLNVIAHDPYVYPGIMEAAGVRPVDLETLLRESDFLTLHAPFTPETRNVINAQSLALMKPGAFLINTARGPLVDEDALLAAIQSGKIAGAGIDVFWVEPPSNDHPFLHEPRIIVTPHTGWYSEESRVDVRHKAAEEVARVLRGEKPIAPANQI